MFAVEPCTSARTEEGYSEAESPLGPGETRSYEIEIAMAGEAAAFDAYFEEQERHDRKATAGDTDSAMRPRQKSCGGWRQR